MMAIHRRLFLLALVSIVATGACQNGVPDGRFNGVPVSLRGASPVVGVAGTVSAVADGVQTGSVSAIKAPKGMVFVPGGAFFRGCNQQIDDTCANSEKPAGMVEVDDFFMDINEVTVLEYTRCVNEMGCSPTPSVGECNFTEPDRLDYPINCVNWGQATDYCRFVGKRLPTEVEWEKAARGVDGRRYPWGNEEPDVGGAYRANWGDGLSRVLWVRDHWEFDAPVGRFEIGASPYGCLDMAGNVAEWVSDWWADSYVGMVEKNPKGPDSGTLRVVRGGSFREYRRRIRTSARDYHSMDFWDGHVGFRCATDLPNRP